MEINFKTVIALVFVAGMGYAWYTGLLGEFVGGFGGKLGSGGNAANQVPMD